MKLSELNNIDLKTLGTVLVPVKGGVIALLCVVLVGGVYYFDTQEQLEQFKQAEVIEGELRQALGQTERMAANLDLYKAQLEKMRHTFGDMLRQLPSKTEIPNLIVDISQTGLANGLEIELFKLELEVRRDLFTRENPYNLAS